MKKNYILLVEDDQDISVVIALILKCAGFTVIQAENGLEAFKILYELPFPSLILLDLNMPVMDGWAFLEQFRKSEFSETPIIVSTASVDHIIPEGISAVLRKPYEIESLLALIGQFFAPTKGDASHVRSRQEDHFSTSGIHLHEMANPTQHSQVSLL